MKKLIYCAAALSALFFAASCQQENLEPASETSTVTYTVDVPVQLQTKAIGDGLNVNELIYEVWMTSAEGTTDLSNATKLYQATESMEEVPVSDGKKVRRAVINLDLLCDKHYTILFWAQVQGTNVYNTDDLRAVTYKDKTLEQLCAEEGSLSANNESLAAFYSVDFIDDGVARKTTINLRRPFAQINLATENARDKSKNPKDYTITLEQSRMTLKHVPTTFNVATSVASNPTTGDRGFTFAYGDVPEEMIPVNGTDYYWAGMNYVFAGQNIELTYDIKAYVNDDQTNLLEVTNTIPNVPIKENFRTNIVGNLLTSKTSYEVVVDADFNSNDYVVVDGKNYISISTAEELANVAAEIANGNADYNNFMLGADIDLAEPQTRALVANWTPIGTPEKPYKGIFDGNGYTIKNLSIVETEGKEDKAYIGFFGYAKDATIKNVTFENVNLNIACLDIDHSQGHIGAVAGSLEGNSTIENVTVKGDIKVEATFDANGASRVAVVAGGNSYGNVTMKNVHVIANEGSYLKANNNVGALAGQLQGISVFENCSSNIDVTGKKFFAGGIIGLAAGNQTFINCHTTGDVAVTAGREGRAHDQYRVGGIAGGWADNVKTPCVLENCSFKGTVSGVNADGSVADPLDYMGYVGRGYTLAGCAGSTVLIDGVGFVQKYNTAAEAGIYDIFYQVTTSAQLQEVLNREESVAAIFMNDIEGNVTVSQKAGVELIINGNDHSFKGVITVDGKSATYTTAGLTVKNLTFDASTISADACIRLGDGTTDTRYTCNVTVDNCTFDVPVAVGVKSYTGGDKNLTITGCTATANAHSLVQAKGIDGILVEKCVVNSKNGLNFNNSDNVTVDGCKADVKGYAVRFGESSGGADAAETYTIKNSTLKSACDDGDAVVILRGTADYATLTIENTKLEGSIQLTNNAKDAKVIIDGKEQKVASDQSSFNSALTGDSDVTLGEGEYTLPSVSSGDVAINGTEDVVITITKPNYSGSDLTLNGVTVKGSGYSTGVQHVNTVTYNDVKVIGEMCLYGDKVVFNGCTFELASGQYIWTYGAKEVEFNNCTFNTNGKAILVYNEGAGASNVTVNGCTFNATEGAKAGDIANQNCAAIEISNFQTSGNGAAHVVTTTGNKWNDNFSGEWRIKKFIPEDPVTVNGVKYSQIAVDGKLMDIDENKNVTVLD